MAVSRTSNIIMNIPTARSACNDSSSYCQQTVFRSCESLEDQKSSAL